MENELITLPTDCLKILNEDTARVLLYVYREKVVSKSQKEIARDVGISRQALGNQLRKLVCAGLIEAYVMGNVRTYEWVERQ